MVDSLPSRRSTRTTSTTASGSRDVAPRMREHRPLPADALYRPCTGELPQFATTAELPDAALMAGQSRAIDAVRFAMDMPHAGHNLFVLGEPGSGRHGVVRTLLEACARDRPAPMDLCYVHNFADATRPRALSVPAGRGARWRRHMQQFGRELATAIPAALESDDHRARMEAIQQETKAREENALKALGQESSDHGVALIRTPHGFVFVPSRGDETLDREEFDRLPKEEKERIGKLIDEYGERLHQLMLQFPRWRREMQQRMRDTTREAVALAVGHLVDELKDRYKDLPEVLGFLDEVLQDILESSGEAPVDDGEEGEAGTVSPGHYQVNLLVDHGGASAAPVVFEDNPNYQNLVGRIDQIAHMGTLVTNFTMIRPGALHRANGGYLMLDAAKVLSHPYAWEGLKRALKAGRVTIETLGQAYGWASATPMEPQPVELSVKVVLFGERMLYYLLKEYDAEFDELFKVAADFESQIERNADNVRDFACFLASVTRRHGLRPLERAAVARVVEHGARLAEDAERLSARTRPIAALVQAADRLAGRAGHQHILRADVDAALRDEVRRAARLRDSLHADILRDTLLIASDGGHVGQVNGLAVVDLVDFRFAHPVRITATARIGEGDVIDIERESELGGPLHSKGVMILSSFLGARYAHSVPLSLAASLVFEQSYGPVEGDSASLAELCALLSVLSGVPILQSLAVTGSVNQHGRVQAVGGVNEKIEGFFDVCAARGLTGAQGVVIPAGNVKHLMLREDVVAAAREGRFHIHAVDCVDDAIEILTGMPAGVPDTEGRVPAGSINFLVAAQLQGLSEQLQRFAGHKKPRRRGKDD